MNNDLKRVFNIDNKYYWRNFDYQKLVERKLEEISSPNYLNLYLVQSTVDNIKSLSIPHSNLNLCRTNLEAIFEIMTNQITNNSNDNSNCMLYTFNQDGITHHKDVFSNNNILECMNKILNSSMHSINSNLTQVLSRVLLSLESKYQEYHDRYKLEEKKKVNVRIFISLSNIELFKEEEVTAILNNMNALFNIVINPIVLSNDIISAKFCRLIEELGFVDCKNSSYKIDSSVEYLDWLMKKNKLNNQVDDLYLELNKIKSSCNNSKFIKSINEKFHGLIRIFETIVRFQKLEKTNIKSDKENSEIQLKEARLIHSNEKKAIHEYIKSESAYLSEVDNLKSELAILNKNKENMLQTISKSGCKFFLKIVNCHYYSFILEDVSKKSELAQLLTETILKVESIF